MNEVKSEIDKILSLLIYLEHFSDTIKIEILEERIK